MHVALWVLPGLVEGLVEGISFSLSNFNGSTFGGTRISLASLFCILLDVNFPGGCIGGPLYGRV